MSLIFVLNLLVYSSLSLVINRILPRLKCEFVVVVGTVACFFRKNSV